jgi:hypothetical protein
MKIAAAVLLVSLVAGCGKEETTDERCRRTIDHVKGLVVAAQKARAHGVIRFDPASDSRGDRSDRDPGRSKKILGGAAEIASMTVCTHEGLSPAQADCITAAQDLDQLMAVETCPAIRDKKPRWLVLPPKQLRRSEPEAGENTQPGK